MGCLCTWAHTHSDFSAQKCFDMSSPPAPPITHLSSHLQVNIHTLMLSRLVIASSWVSFSSPPAGSQSGGLSSLPPSWRRRSWHSLPSRLRQQPHVCFCRVHRHAEYRGAVHLHCRPTTAALRDLLHWGARGAHHDRLRLCKHWLPTGGFPEGRKLASPAALPLPCSHLMRETFGTCGRGRRTCVSTSVCVWSFVQDRLSQSSHLWDGCSSSPGHFGYMSPITTPLKQCQMQAEDPSPKCGTVSSELFQGHIYWLSIPGRQTEKFGQYKLSHWAPLGGFFLSHHESHEPCRQWYSSLNGCCCSRTSALRSLSISLLMNGSLQAFFQMAPLELYRMLALNRKNVRDSEAFIFQCQKNFTGAFCWQAGALTKTWAQFGREGEPWWSLAAPLTSCSAFCAAVAVHSTDTPLTRPAASWAPGRRRGKAAVQPFRCLSGRGASPHLALVCGNLSLHPIPLAGISPHVATGRLISASCVSKDFAPRLTATYRG